MLVTKRVVFIFALCATCIWIILYFNVDRDTIPFLFDPKSLSEALINVTRRVTEKLMIECNGTLIMIHDTPVIFALTATYTRMTQKADLTRLAQTLLHVPNFCWIVTEDSEEKTALVSRFLIRSKVPFVHLAAKAPPGKRGAFLRGQMQRQAGLSWITNNVDINRRRGVLYVMDDDNTYDVRLFEEMRYTNKLSVFPVGIVGGAQFESPVVKNGKIVNWAVLYNPGRRFPLDFAAVAVNIKIFWEKPGVTFPLVAGEQESLFFTQFANRSDLEPKAKNCTEILVWHTKTHVPGFGPYTDKQLADFGIERLEV